MAFNTALVAILSLRALLTHAVQLRQSSVESSDPAISGLAEVSDAELLDFDGPGGCARGHDCGLLAEAQSPPVRVPCKDGEKFMAHDALYIPNPHGDRGLVYCAVPKVGTSYTFYVMGELHLQSQHGKRNSGYQKVHEIVASEDEDAIEELCKAYSFIIIRNPWDRIASGYVDKMLTKTLTNHPPKFDGFMQQIEQVNASLLSHHFKPASILCSTTGEQRHEYDRIIHLEGNLQKQFQKMFVQELHLPKDKVQRVLEKGIENGRHHSSANFSIDPSVNSGLDRVSYYFRHDKIRNIVTRVFKDDIEFGNYKYNGMPAIQVQKTMHHLSK